MTERCDEIELTLIIRAYDANGQPVSERALPPRRVFVHELDLPALITELNRQLQGPNTHG